MPSPPPLMQIKPPRPLVLWRFTDGKAGHEKQSLGLCHALERLTPSRTFDIEVQGGWKNALHWLSGRFPDGSGLPAPDLLVGAGHATHWPMLAARRAFGGRIVVLMRPSLPLALFDLCLIPRHDSPPRRPNVISTTGAINNLVPGGDHQPHQGLILVGGPSGHFQWDSGSLARQIGELARARPDMHWALTTSRRTPDDFLQAMDNGDIQVFPAEATPSGWLEGQLARAGEAWVTPDSVSMVYEALTAGCRVGLFDLPAKPTSRVAKGVLALKADGLVSAFPHPPRPNRHPLNEADRCANLILERWFT